MSFPLVAITKKSTFFPSPFYDPDSGAGYGLHYRDSNFLFSEKPFALSFNHTLKNDIRVHLLGFYPKVVWTPKLHYKLRVDYEKWRDFPNYTGGTNDPQYLQRIEALFDISLDFFFGTRIGAKLRFNDTIQNDSQWLLARTLYFSYDDRDDFFFPKNGLQFEFDFEAVDATFGGDLNYQEFAFEASYLTTIGEPDYLTIALRGRIEQLILRKSAYFYEVPALGGADSLRAFSNRRFPADGFWLGNVELRHPLFNFPPSSIIRRIETAPFFDIGQTTPGLVTFHLRDLHMDGGIGIRTLVSPDFIVRVDIATNLNNTNAYIRVDYPF